ncbi:DNA-directed RNA polymerase subunit alpha [Candidatus Uhrbacteria bacterium]|nr:DNA-directed RNA polymerase subunit alpha [Candidatus Uhrbacteria bacterium]
MHAISLPTKLEFIQKDGSPYRGQVVVEPCAAGYGTTVGNALRRVLLSSLPGAAITAVAIKGAQHEFSTIPHVKEDVVQILLNLKQVRLKLFQDEPLTVKLHVEGERAVTAGDIEPNSQMEVVNREHVIATLTDPTGVLDMELTLERGRGYIPVEARDTHVQLPLGTIAVDAIYTPIVNVGYHVEHARVGQMTNFDRLILDVDTDGTITVEDAVHEAGKLLIDYFTFIVSGPQILEEAPAADVVVPEASPIESATPIPESAPVVEVTSESESVDATTEKKKTKKKKTEAEV